VLGVCGVSVLTPRYKRFDTTGTLVGKRRRRRQPTRTRGCVGGPKIRWWCGGGVVVVVRPRRRRRCAVGTRTMVAW